MGFPRNSLELYGLDLEMFEYLDFDMKIEQLQYFKFEYERNKQVFLLTLYYPITSFKARKPVELRLREVRFPPKRPRTLPDRHPILRSSAPRAPKRHPRPGQSDLRALKESRALKVKTCHQTDLLRAEEEGGGHDRAQRLKENL